ncbi:MAG: hypothetical protein AB1410_08195 [Acidobacteriota bacterium]
MGSIKKIYTLFIFLYWIFSSILSSQMVNPAIDRDEKPFSYFRYPVDVVGIMDGREGTEITPEGYLYTGYCELMFFTGSPPEPVNQRVKTLYKGYLPIIQYQFIKEDVKYSVTIFAFTLNGSPGENLINFIKIEFQNLSNSQRSVYWTAGTRYTAESNYIHGVPDHRFKRPAKSERIGTYEQAGEEFNPEWQYEFSDGMMMRDKKVLYFFPEEIKHKKLVTLRNEYRSEYKKPRIMPTTPVGLVKFEIKLDLGETKSLVLKMPYHPVCCPINLFPTNQLLVKHTEGVWERDFPMGGECSVKRLRRACPHRESVVAQKDNERYLSDMTIVAQEDNLIEKIKNADFDEYLKITVNYWEKILGEGIEIYLSEEKVINTFKANLIYDLIARDKIGKDYVQKVNEFQYDAFWLRDSSYIVRNYDISGYHKIAEQCLDFFLKWQNENGNFISQGGQYDGWGQTLWAFGQHYKITNDLNFAKKVYHSVKRAMEWLHNATKKDPLKIMPVTTSGDNELITGHVTGHNFWALAGIKNAIILANALEEKQDVKFFKKEYEDYFKNFLKALKYITKKSGGYIPPGLDDLSGQNWGNMLSVYPEKILNPFDQMVTATLNHTKKKYQEGIMTYGDGKWLHLYLTMKNTETEVIRGEQEEVLEEFYSMLMHTSSTHTGFEFSILPWGDRDFGQNLTPHGWFAAKFRVLLRNMLLREEDKNLHLLSVISPVWVEDGKETFVKNAPTDFGKIDFSIKFKKDGALVYINSQFRMPPEKIIIHIPFFVDLISAKADEKKAKIKDQTILIPSATKKVELLWKKKSEIPEFSYEKTVKDYKEEYRKKFKEFLEKGEK